MNISIRLLGKDELKLVRKVADIVWPVTFKEILSPEQIDYMMEMMYAAKVMDKEFDEGIKFYGVFDGQNVVGYLIWGHYDGAPQTAKLHKCYLLPTYQGKGIGSMMLKTAQSMAREAGYKYLRLNVNRQNAKAIKAYDRNGFKTIETVDNPIGNGFYMNDYVMETDL